MHSKEVPHQSEGPFLSGDGSSSLVICLVLQTECVSPQTAALSEALPQLSPSGDRAVRTDPLLWTFPGNFPRKRISSDILQEFCCVVPASSSLSPASLQVW